MKNKNSILSIMAVTAVIFASCSRNDMDVNSGSGAEELSVPAAIQGAAGEKVVPNQVLVKFREGLDEMSKQQLFGKFNAKVAQHIFTKSMKHAGEREGIYLLNMPLEVYQAISQLKNMPEIEFAEPNFIYTHAATSNDPYYTNGNLWGMYGSSTSPSNQYGCGAGTAWAAGKTGSTDVVVGVIDEGVMNTHTDLSANIWTNNDDPIDGVDNDQNGYTDDYYGWNFVKNSNKTYEGTSDDHATHVAGTIGAKGGNGTGVAGVNWSVKIISAKFLGNNGGTTANAILAVDYMTNLKVDNGVNIVATNNSWGGGGFSAGLWAAINRARNAGILFIAAAGNSGTNNDVTPSYPSSYCVTNGSYAGLDNIISVAAISSNGSLASFSQYGANSVHIGAPGVAINSTVPKSGKQASGYASYNGTSMATPHVTGAAALYYSLNPTASYLDIKNAILSSATATNSLNGKCSSGGRLNVSGF